VLDPRQFFRANRQLLTPLSAVRRLHPYFNGNLKLDLHSEFAEEAVISRDKADPLKAWLEGELPVGKAAR
jgi:two-component system LytT family response regulator